MAKNNLSAIVVIFIIIILVLSTQLIKALVVDMELQYGYTGRKQVMVQFLESIFDLSLNNNSVMLSLTDYLQERKIKYAPVIKKDLTLAFKNRKVQTLALGTTAEYLFFQTLPFLKGNFIREKEWLNYQQNNVVVLSDQIAYKLFGSIKGCGNIIQVDSEKFMVIGIIDTSGDNFTSLWEETQVDCFFHIDVLQRLSGLNSTSYLLFSSMDDSFSGETLLDTTKYIENKTGLKNRYEIINFSLELSELERVSEILSFFLWSLCVFCLFKLLYRLLVKEIAKTKLLYVSDYFLKIFKDRWKVYLGLLLLFTTSGFLIYQSSVYINFFFWVPQRLFPSAMEEIRTLWIEGFKRLIIDNKYVSVSRIYFVNQFVIVRSIVRSLGSFSFLCIFVLFILRKFLLNVKTPFIAGVIPFSVLIGSLFSVLFLHIENFGLYIYLKEITLLLLFLLLIQLEQLLIYKKGVNKNVSDNTINK